MFHNHIAQLTREYHIKKFAREFETKWGHVITNMAGGVVEAATLSLRIVHRGVKLEAALSSTFPCAVFIMQQREILIIGKHQHTWTDPTKNNIVIRLIVLISGTGWKQHKIELLESPY